MKKWKCTVCGYIHEGDSPPDECPLCKAPAESFEELIEEVTEEVTEKVTEEGGEEVSGRRWKCTICGYIHEGDAPPEECPICKAGPDKFVEVDDEGNELADESAGAESEPPSKASKTGPGLLARVVMKLHLHPISVHMPNGILPAAVLFLAVALFMGIQVFEVAAFYNLVFVLATMPVVLLTGFLEWKNRYRGATTFIFFTKIFCSIIVTLCLTTLVVWRFIEPGVAGAESPFRLIYFGIAVVMLAATGIAGHLGGKLVFGTRGD